MESFNNYIISKKAIYHNLKILKKINKDCKVCAVVKANGYGLGAQNVVKQVDNNIDFYAVACMREAIELRKHTQKPVLILNFVPIKSFENCIKLNISISVCGLDEVKLLCKYINNHKKDFYNTDKAFKKINIHLAINTGMNRVGFKNVNDFFGAIKQLKKYQRFINIEGIFTHFHNSANDEKTNNQFCIFMQFVKILSLYFDIDKIIKHVANSYSAVKNKKYGLDMVRVGILLYGSLEDKKYLNKLKLKQTLQIKTKIINITHIKKGEFVGYGKNFVAKKDMIIGTIPLGYADGIFRSYAKKGFVLCGGKRCKIVGNICMDMFMIDVSNIKAKIFDEVVVIGVDKFGNEITIDEVAKNCDTISYEILTNIKKQRFEVKIE